MLPAGWRQAERGGRPWSRSRTTAAARQRARSDSQLGAATAAVPEALCVGAHGHGILVIDSDPTTAPRSWCEEREKDRRLRLIWDPLLPNVGSGRWGAATGWKQQRRVGAQCGR